MNLLEVSGLPENQEAERSVLGAILEDGSQFEWVDGLLSPDDFSTEKHRRIFAAMQELHADGVSIDAVTVGGFLHDSGRLQSIGGLTFLSELNDNLAQIFGMEDHVRMVKDKSILRRYIVGCQKQINECLLNADSTDVLERAEKFIRGLSSENSGSDRPPSTALEIIRADGGLDGFLKKSQATGIRTPWSWLNRQLGGWRPMELSIVAARPSVGKTAMSLQVAETAAAAGIVTAIFSLEMSKDQLITRMICARARVEMNIVRQDRLEPEHRSRLHRAANEVTELPILYDDNTACTVPAMTAALRRMNARDRVGLVVIDYLQLMQSTGRHGNANEAVSAISRGLKIATRDFSIPFVVLSQLTRANEHQGRRPVLSDLRDSGSIEQDADNVIFLHPKEKTYDRMRPIELIIAKQRNGPVGTKDMVFIADYCRLEELTDEEDHGADSRSVSAGF